MLLAKNSGLRKVEFETCSRQSANRGIRMDGIPVRFIPSR